MRRPIGSIRESRQGVAASARFDRTRHLDRLDAPERRHRPHGRGLSPEQESLLELQSLAGNAAVTRALTDGRASGRVTTVDTMDLVREGMSPEKGVEQIREKTTNKMTIALTQRGIGPYPPIMRAQSPEKV